VGGKKIGGNPAPSIPILFPSFLFTWPAQSHTNRVAFNENRHFLVVITSERAPGRPGQGNDRKWERNVFTIVYATHRAVVVVAVFLGAVHGGNWTLMRPTFFLFIALSEYRASWIPELWKRQLADSCRGAGSISVIHQVFLMLPDSSSPLAGW